MFKNFPLAPESASTVAWQVDGLYYLLVLVSLFFTVVVAVAVIYFAVKYRRRHPDELPPQYEPFHWLENAFIGGMTVVFLTLFVIAAKVYFTVQRPPDDALNVYATGRQWMWKFQHIGGQAEINELHVPLNRPVKLTMASEDVIHSFYVPAFRVKRDVLPSRFTEVWFQATKPGRYHLFCAEYCGTEHSGMIGSVVVMEASEYQAWLQKGGRGPGAGAGGGVQSAASTPEQAGQELFTNLGCVTCHKSQPGGLGPVLAGVPGSNVKLADGATVQANDDYIRESILNPRAKVVAGFQPVMPSFAGQVSQENLVQLIAYIKSLGGAPQNAAPTTGAAAAPAKTSEPSTQQGTAAPSAKANS